MYVMPVIRMESLLKIILIWDMVTYCKITAADPHAKAQEFMYYGQRRMKRSHEKSKIVYCPWKYHS